MSRRGARILFVWIILCVLLDAVLVGYALVYGGWNVFGRMAWMLALLIGIVAGPILLMWLARFVEERRLARSARRIIRREVPPAAPETARCPRCQYPIADLPVSDTTVRGVHVGRVICPECGHREF